jgi:hypothetical protein
MTKKPIKIIGFDSWVGGYRHYERLLPSLEERSMELTLVHISSWGNDPESSGECRIGNLKARDISFYGNSLVKVLETERPDAVVLLSTDTFAHRAFIRYCKQRRIPTLHLTHGIESIFGQSGNEAGVPTRSKAAHVRYICSKLGKLFRYTLPCYFKALLVTNASAHEWFRFFSDIFVLARGGEPACEKASEDAKATKGAVYIPADSKHEMSCYGFREEDVFVVGNPDITQFGLTDELIGGWKQPESAVKKYVMYIETGLSSQATMYAGTEGFIRHLINTSSSLASQGYKMRLKLKPDQVNTSLIIEGLADSDIEIVSNDVFLRSLIECSACIAETSTLALLPALIGMPMLLAKYGDLATLSFGSILESYPKGYSLLDVRDTSKILRADLVETDREALNVWIQSMVGPLPSEKMPDRVVSIIENMIAGGIE